MADILPKSPLAPLDTEDWEAAGGLELLLSSWEMVGPTSFPLQLLLPPLHSGTHGAGGFNMVQQAYVFIAKPNRGTSKSFGLQLIQKSLPDINYVVSVTKRDGKKGNS